MCHSLVLYVDLNYLSELMIISIVYKPAKKKITDVIVGIDSDGYLHWEIQKNAIDRIIVTIGNTMLAKCLRH